jgi:outer membrane protein assembly factor BamA
LKLTIKILILLFAPLILHAQNDSLEKSLKENEGKIDSLNLKVNNIIVTGNDVTKQDIILREMQLKKGSYFKLRKYSEDILNIYNLGLFTKVDIYPIPQPDKEITLNVDVKERWYILPLPNAGIEEGEWKKFWASMNIRWDNFRGRNESVNVGARIFYNPSVSARYFVPWIGDKLHLFMGIGGAWQRTRNQSLKAVGIESGNSTIDYDDKNYDNIQYRAELNVGRYFGRNFAVFTDYKFNYLKVTEYETGRTMSPAGVDRYLTIGVGISYDSRDINEYATKGDYMRTSYSRFGFIDDEIDFGRFIVENQSFIPLYLKKDYYVTFASKLYTSFAIGAVIPIYNHEYLGYSDDFIRGWKGQAFEGDDVFTLYNELRIPIITPRYIKADKMAVIRDIPIIKNLDLRHGLYFTFIYDIGTVWYKHESINKKRFISGAGIGLNVIAPFGYVIRIDWVFRLGTPTVGEVGLTLSSKF